VQEVQKREEKFHGGKKISGKNPKLANKLSGKNKCQPTPATRRPATRHSPREIRHSPHTPPKRRLVKSWLKVDPQLLGFIRLSTCLCVIRSHLFAGITSSRTQGSATIPLAIFDPNPKSRWPKFQHLRLHGAGWQKIMGKKIWRRRERRVLTVAVE